MTTAKLIDMPPTLDESLSSLQGHLAITADSPDAAAFKAAFVAVVESPLYACRHPDEVAALSAVAYIIRRNEFSIRAAYPNGRSTDITTILHDEVVYPELLRIGEWLAVRSTKQTALEHRARLLRKFHRLCVQLAVIRPR
jgi:hypothetical protein